MSLAASRVKLFFTVKIHNSSPEEAARWVAEAKKRGMGGSYWCFGNEPYFKADRFYVTKEAYVELVNRFSPAMKAADPDIHLGIGCVRTFCRGGNRKGPRELHPPQYKALGGLH